MDQIKSVLAFLNRNSNSYFSSKIFIRSLPVYLSLLFGFVIALQLINLTWKIIYPVNSVTYSKDSSLLKNNSVDAYKNLSGDPFIKGTNQSLNQVFSIDIPPTSLSLRLYGIRYSNSGQLDAAILGFDPNNQRIYKTNEVIADDIILEFIEPERVVISRRGIRESVTFDSDTVLSPEITKALANSSKGIKVEDINSSALSQMISFQPYFSNGTLKGYQIYPRNQSKLFDSSGLKSGDVLVAVNGLDIKDPSVLKELSVFGQVKLDLIRDDDDLSIIVKLN
jgi:type II secretion system protein C